MQKHGRVCGGCGCRLSQYNQEPLCATCARGQRLVACSAPRVPDTVWRETEVQAAIAAWEFGRVSRLVRKAAGLRQDDIAFMTGLSQGHVSMLEAGSRRLTSLEKVAQFLNGIGAPDALLPAPLGGVQQAASTPLAPERTSLNEGNSGGGRQTSDARNIAARAAAQSLQFVEEITNSNVSDVELVKLEAEVARLATEYVHAPLHSLFEDLLSTRDSIFSLLKGRQPPRQARELFLLAGTSCLLIAHASQNLGDEGAAIAQLQTAWTLAEHADRDDLRAWVKGTAALFAEWSPRQQAALDYAQQAMLLASGGETRARIAAIEARTAARVKDSDRAIAALDELKRARELRAEPGGLTRFGGLLTFPVAKQEYYIGGTYALLGKHRLAEEHATAAIRLYESGPQELRSYGDEALARLDIVTARIAAGEVEGAGEQLRPILELPEDRRIRQLGDAMHGVARLLEDPRFARSRRARELADEARGYQVIDTRAKVIAS
ncbi:helix-turn-helix transcriptional regulator [Streptomyces sp. NPDC048342]|uniref:helix-turn-helix domain-containing protein n=1 Tax=unclassified Streptomyces TaxID=2593676 RepID=UPI0034426655